MLTCAGKALLPFKTEPRTVNFGLLKRDAEPQTKTVTITRGDGGPLKLAVLPGGRNSAKAALREIEPGERYELEVTIEPPWPNQRLRSRINLSTGIAEAPRGTIQVYAQVTPRLAVRPNRFTLPNVIDKDYRQTARLVWDDGKPHPILSASINDPNMTVTVEEDSGRQNLVLQVPSGYQRKSGAKYVMIRTDDTRVPNLRLPVVFRGTAKPPPAPKTTGAGRRPGPGLTAKKPPTVHRAPEK